MKNNFQNILLIGLCVVLVVVLAGLIVLMVTLDREPAAPTTTAPVTTTQPPTTQAPTTEPTTEPTTVPPTTLPIPEISPNKLSIYIPADDGTQARNRVLNTIQITRTPKVDIDCFEFIASDTARLTGWSFSKIWNDAWALHEGTEAAKIGIRLQFTLQSGECVDQMILKPSDAASFYEYLEVYLYDDVHQSGWYSHLEDDDMTDGTMITSVKLTSGEKIAEVGDIILTAFVYTGDDCFDADGNYIGLVSDTITVVG